MLDELRQKPHALKEAYAFWGAVFLTGLVVSVWLVSVSARLADEGMIVASTTGQQQTASALSQFFRDMKTSVTDRWQGSVGASLADPTEQSGVTSTPTTTSPARAETTSSLGSTESPILIGTSSPRTIQIATSSASER